MREIIRVANTDKAARSNRYWSFWLWFSLCAAQRTQYKTSLTRQCLSTASSQWMGYSSAQHQVIDWEFKDIEMLAFEKIGCLESANLWVHLKNSNSPRKIRCENVVFPFRKNWPFCRIGNAQLFVDCDCSVRCYEANCYPNRRIWRNS